MSLESFVAGITDSVQGFADWIWNLPLLMLLLGGGLFFLLRSGFIPVRHFFYAIQILRGRYDSANDQGEVSHYKALSVAMSSTIGMGNISGVAIAVALGGPGVIFWMWVTAFVGMATKYFTCTLAILYRGYDDQGRLQGGPMYFIVQGLGPNWRPLAQFFCWAAMVACLPVFTVNQLTQATTELVLLPAGMSDTTGTRLLFGVVLCSVTAVVVLGGLKRIATAAAGLVPLMVIAYLVMVLGILWKNYAEVPAMFGLIITEAFSAEFYRGEALLGSALGGLILLGARRATFSNEAGVGTAPLAHGAAKTNQPVHEGLVAMLGPAIDTLVVCTLTAVSILVTGAWKHTGLDGISMVLESFRASYSDLGPIMLYFCICSFALSSLFSFSYYGTKCAAFLFGTRRAGYYRAVYLLSILLAAVASTGLIVSIIDIAFALMAIPTMTATLLLSSRVVRATREYFERHSAR